MLIYPRLSIPSQGGMRGRGTEGRNAGTDVRPIHEWVEVLQRAAARGCEDLAGTTSTCVPSERCDLRTHSTRVCGHPQQSDAEERQRPGLGNLRQDLHAHSGRYGPERQGHVLETARLVDGGEGESQSGENVRQEFRSESDTKNSPGCKREQPEGGEDDVADGLVGGSGQGNRGLGGLSPEFGQDDASLTIGLPCSVYTFSGRFTWVKLR
jgi:hypothetical protein